MAAADLLEVYVPFTKREKDPKTGHLYVYGKITGSDLDHDQQRMDANWLKTAVPDWFRIGNIRMQHDPKTAVGKAVELDEKPDGWYVGAKVVDRDAIVKVEEDVLTGFSIGVKNHRLDFSNKADAPNGTCVAGRIVETSLVDAPCLGSARIEEHYRLPLAKSDSAGELQPIERPALERTAATTYGLPQELYDRLAAPVKQALADLADAGATVAAHPEVPAETQKAEAPAPLVVNVTVSGPVLSEHELATTGNADHTAEAAREALEKAYTAEQKRAALKAGQAMENANGDPAYTIKTKGDLRRAIKAVGRGGTDHDDIRKHIITRAKALGLEGMVPDNWNADGSLKDAQKADEATVEKAESVLRDVRALVPSLAKADDEPDAGAAADEDESDDIAGAQEAITCIAKLIVSEAESLAAGNLNEAVDIALLLDAVRALKWFQVNERNEQSGADEVMMLADSATGGGDLLKTDGAQNAPVEEPQPTAGAPVAEAAKAEAADGERLLTKAEAAEAVKAAVAAALAETANTKTTAADEPQTVTKTELADMVRSAVAEARAADEERITALTTDLAKAQGDLEAIKAMPVPGGPVLTRTAAQQASASKSDADDLHAQAAELLAKAERFSANRDLADGYRQRAKTLLAKAAA